ncbi:hypothetical protein, partial [Neolewinella aurantiaca]|uniref:hypothetical protein n=1 Tax=Neolewinella aurantiaca TaxID=2602767 RepID=UPI001C9C50F4
TALIFWFVFYQEKMNGQNRKKRSFRGEYIIFASLTSPCLPTAFFDRVTFQRDQPGSGCRILAQ